MIEKGEENKSSDNKINESFQAKVEFKSINCFAL